MSPQHLRLFLACCLLAQVRAHRFFTANLVAAPGTNGSPVSATYSMMIHTTKATWILNSTAPLTAAAIVDGLPTRKSQEVVKLLPAPTAAQIAPPAPGPPAYNGTFLSSDLNPAVGYDVVALQGHIGMGHIFVTANASDGGLIFGPLREITGTPAAEVVETEIMGGPDTGPDDDAPEGAMDATMPMSGGGAQAAPVSQGPAGR